MKDEMKTKKQLIDEVITLRKRVAEGEVSKDKQESRGDLLLKSGERFRYFVENANDIVYSLTPDGIFTYASPNWTEILGHDVQEVVGQSFESFVHPEDIPVCRAFLERVVATGKKQAGVEYRVRHKTGAWRWHITNASPVRYADGNIISYMGIARDITDRKRAEEALRESEEKYRLVVENAGEAISVIQDGVRKFVNHRAVELLGYSKEELTSKHFTEFVHPDDREIVFERHTKRMKNENVPSVYTSRIIAKDGAVKWIETHTTLISWNGKPAALVFFIEVSDRERTKEALRASELRYQTIFETTGTTMLIVEEDMTISLANQGFESLTGYRREEIEGKKKWTEFVEKGDLERMITHHQLRRVESGLAKKSYEFRLVHRDGHLKNIFLTVDVIPGTKKSIASLMDITDRKQAEVALRESEERYRTLVENANDIIFRTDSTGHFMFINPVALRLSGFTLEELIGKHYLAIIRPDMRDASANFFGRQFVKKLENTYFEYPIIIKNGQERWIGQNTQLMLEDGRVIGFQAVARDVTERKQFEEALSESERLYKTLAESSLAGVFIVQDGKFRFINTSAIAYAGYSAEELVGRSSDIIVHPDDKELVKSKNREMLAGRSNQAFEFRMVTKQNDVRWVSQTVTPINYRGRRAILGNAMDITDRKRMEVELLENERKYRYLYQEFRAILNAIPSAVLLSPDLKVVWANEGAATSMNISPADFIGQYCYQVRYARSEPCEICPVLGCFASGKPTSGESVTPDGRIWELHAMPIFGDQGEVKGVIEAPRDISARKQAEEARYHHEKIKGVLEMAGAICHEMNQPMQVISGYSEMLLMNISENDPIYTKLDTINKQVHRMADITRKLMKIKDYETQDYAGLSRIIDINKSSDKDTE